MPDFFSLVATASAILLVTMPFSSRGWVQRNWCIPRQLALLAYSGILRCVHLPRKKYVSPATSAQNDTSMFSIFLFSLVYANSYFASLNARNRTP
ncbi:hypothetical protein BDN71DRAFT_1444543 [Pleurotus eryngii]|uniref:Uncharacterized protein n=1 Tax=Pleurotus eryngii TaxID=5323 RepID=A0A9P6A0K7_PLEER|nr:hypothetical protein BDN71DRAFT_1444543 [Pleurotus eryngii]